MKKLLIASALLFVFGCSSSPKHEKTVEKEETVTFHGEKITADNAITTEELMQKMASTDSIGNLTVSGKVISSCPKKGCWMKLEVANGEPVMVQFKDYGFFVPTDLKAGDVTIKGIAKKEITSVEMLKHYAEDAGKPQEEIDKITEPKENIKFVADGVILTQATTTVTEKTTQTY